jgi:hypothetical protein
MAIIIGCCMIVEMGGAGCATSEESSRTISLTVTVLDHAGHGLQGVCLSMMNNNSSTNARTNASGIAHLTAEFPFVAGPCEVRVSIAPMLSLNKYDRQAEDLTRYNEIVLTESFRGMYTLSLADGQNERSLEVRSVKAMTVKGRVVCNDGSALLGSIGCATIGSDSDLSPIDGSFMMNGIPRNSVSAYCVYAMDDAEILCQRLSASQTSSEEFDLGIITYPRQTNLRDVELTLVDAADLKNAQMRPCDASDAITCVRTDGARIYGFTITNTGRAIFAKADQGAKLPPGTYYVAPGQPDACGAGNRLVELMLAGRGAEIAAAGVQTLTIPENDPVGPIVIHGRDAEGKILAIP